MRSLAALAYWEGVILLGGFFGVVLWKLLTGRISLSQLLEGDVPAIGYGLLILIFLFGLMILLEIASGKIDLSLLLSETSGGASMSRFQLLIFTFVISLSFFLLVAQSGQFPAIPPEVLTLLGISASTYAVSKGIQASGVPPKKRNGNEKATTEDQPQ